MDQALPRIVVVVPTRNRAALAVNAIRSVLEQDCPHVRVLVSDNSTSAEEARKLARFCRDLADERLRYVQPPEPLPMSRHWDWAIEQAMQDATASHFLYLTDRMLLRPGELRRLSEILTAYPERVVSYNHDRIIDHVRPVRVQQLPWTGELYEVESRELLSLVSRSVLYHPALPKMLNCVAPRRILNTLRERFGTVFDSVSPDFNFCFRCLDTVESVLYYDCSVLIHYALDRSNGMGFERGVLTPDHEDFLATLGVAESLYFSTPAPEVQTVGNAIFHEYCTVRRETGSPRFPEVEREPYLEYLGREVELLEVPEFQERMRSLLSEHGWRAPPLGPRQQRVADAAARLGLSQRGIGRVVGMFSRAAQLAQPSVAARELRSSATALLPGGLWLRLHRWLGLSRSAGERLRFGSREAALDFALCFPLPKSPRPDHLPGRLRDAPEPSRRARRSLPPHAPQAGDGRS
jgi:hypothetical protein